jgi:DNA topoisomerase III
MSKGLIIAEKPSIARDIAQALGGFKLLERSDSQSAQIWENDQYILSHALGHLVELAEPQDYDPALKAWKFSQLPILPQHFKHLPKSETKGLLQSLTRLIHRADVSFIINACDAAREGELIFRDLIQHAHSQKPIKRLWLQSLTLESIRQSFQNLKDGNEFLGLANAARSRAFGDWLIGMNMTRGVTLKMSRPSDPSVWSVGRVQTPTLALLVDREIEIQNFVPKDFCRIQAHFLGPNGPYESFYVNQSSLVDDASATSSARSEGAAPKEDDLAFYDLLKAEQKLVDLQKLKTDPSTFYVAVNRETTSEQTAPSLFSLTALQRYMAQEYKWSSKRTLNAAQKCYETYKVLTYPRTDSEALPEDYREKMKEVLNHLSDMEPYRAFIQPLLTGPWHNEEKIFDQSKVSDHFAIIPTGQRRANMDDDCHMVYDAVVRRTIAALMPSAKYAVSEIMTAIVPPGKNSSSLANQLEHSLRQIPLTQSVKMIQCEIVKTFLEALHESPVDGALPHLFRSRPKRHLIFEGWQIVYNKTTPALSQDTTWPESTAKVGLENLTLLKEQTRPPNRYTEAQILYLMEHIQSKVQDSTHSKILKRAGGLGTPATRADIIENLKSKGYVTPRLEVTAKAMELIRFLRLSKLNMLTSPVLTAAMEERLSAIECLKETKEKYLQDQAKGMQEAIDKLRVFDVDRSFDFAPELGPCPRCNMAVRERMWSYSCVSNRSTSGAAVCGFALPKIIEGRFLDPLQIKTLIANPGGTIVFELGPTSSHRGLDSHMKVAVLKSGVLSILVGNPTSQKWRPLDSVGASSTEGKAPKKTLWGPCPVHHGDSCQIVETKKAFLCETMLRSWAQGDNQTRNPDTQTSKANLSPGGFYLPKAVCGVTLKFREIQNYLHNGRTSVIEGFKSKAGKQFSAAIVRKADGQWQFEFASATPNPRLTCPSQDLGMVST